MERAVKGGGRWREGGERGWEGGRGSERDKTEGV